MGKRAFPPEWYAAQKAKGARMRAAKGAAPARGSGKAAISEKAKEFRMGKDPSYKSDSIWGAGKFASGKVNYKQGITAAGRGTGNRQLPPSGIKIAKPKDFSKKDSFKKSTSLEEVKHGTAPKDVRYARKKALLDMARKAKAEGYQISSFKTSGKGSGTEVKVKMTKNKGASGEKTVFGSASKSHWGETKTKKNRNKSSIGYNKYSSTNGIIRM